MTILLLQLLQLLLQLFMFLFQPFYNILLLLLLLLLLSLLNPIILYTLLITIPNTNIIHILQPFILILLHFHKHTLNLINTTTTTITTLLLLNTTTITTLLLPNNRYNMEFIIELFSDHTNSIITSLYFYFQISSLDIQSIYSQYIAIQSVSIILLTLLDTRLVETQTELM